jgi:hypothetical protein
VFGCLSFARVQPAQAKELASAGRSSRVKEGTAPPPPEPGKPVGLRAPDVSWGHGPMIGVERAPMGIGIDRDTDGNGAGQLQR